MAFDGVRAGHLFVAGGAPRVFAIGEVGFHVSVAVADVGEGRGGAGVEEAVELGGCLGGGVGGGGVGKGGCGGECTGFLG